MYNSWFKRLIDQFWLLCDVDMMKDEKRIGCLCFWGFRLCSNLLAVIEVMEWLNYKRIEVIM